MKYKITALPIIMIILSVLMLVLATQLLVYADTETAVLADDPDSNIEIVEEPMIPLAAPDAPDYTYIQMAACLVIIVALIFTAAKVMKRIDMRRLRRFM